MAPQDHTFDKKTIRRSMSPALRHVPLFFYPETDSTNLRARAYAESHPFCKTAVFVADRQTAGRGRRGRSFLSEPGVGVYMSFLLPVTKEEEADILSQTAIAAAHTYYAVRRLINFNPEIKWVNDIVYQDKKLVGILTEGVFSPKGKLTHRIVGIGINVKRRNFPPELAGIAASLEDFTEYNLDRSLLVGRIMEAFYWPRRDHAGLMQYYRERFSLTGKTVTLSSPAGEKTALVLDVDDHGALLVRYPDGSEEAIISGEVTLRKQ